MAATRPNMPAKLRGSRVSTQGINLHNVSFHAVAQPLVNITLVRALIVLLPVSLLFIASIRLVTCGRTLGSLVQLLGSSCLLLVVFTHICEGLGLFPRMAWGHPHSAGHYLDLAGAVLGVALVPLGIGIRMLRRSTS